MTAYRWDFENRLTSITLPDGQTVTYAYDPFGRRIAKTVDGRTTTYTYDSEDILFETVNGSLGNVYIHGPGIDEPLALLDNRKTTYYHADGLGSIVAMTDDEARNVQQYEYDSFGNQHDMKNRIKQPYGYTGREHDRETGLRYYRARYYDGEVGSFISEDPLRIWGYSGAYWLDGRFVDYVNAITQSYVYVRNNSINNTDPSGEVPVNVIAAGGLSVLVNMVVQYNKFGSWFCIDLVEAGIAGVTGAIFPGLVGTYAKAMLIGTKVTQSTQVGIATGMIVRKSYDVIPPEMDGPYGRLSLRIGELFTEEDQCECQR